MFNARAIQMLFSALARFFASLLLVGFATFCLLRVAPGYGSDERELDARFSQESMDHFRQSADRGNVFTSYARFLCDAAQADFGFSSSLNRPVRELIQERYRTTSRILGLGLAIGWLSAFVLASLATIFRARALRWSGTLASASILCLPSALLAYMCYVARAPAFLIVALVIFARVYRMMDSFFRATREKYHMLAVRACGLSEFRMFARHILPAASAEIVALTGASVSIAFGATIAAEALCSEPGLGQLAWKAALSRDLPLLLSLTLLIAALTLFCNRLADVYVQSRRRAA